MFPEGSIILSAFEVAVAGRGVATVGPGRAQALPNQRVIPRGRTWSNARWAPAYGVAWCAVSTTVSNGRRFPVLQPGSEEIGYVSIFT